jgi:hypothetical protein
VVEVSDKTRLIGMLSRAPNNNRQPINIGNSTGKAKP